MSEKDERREILALYVDDLEEALQHLGLWEKFQRRELTCHFCERVLTLENLGTISYYQGEIILTCDDDECIRKAYLRREEDE